MDKQTKGAWIIHHGRKVASDERGASEYSAIDVAAKAASLLIRLAESSQSTLNKEAVVAAARFGKLNPKTELPVCLNQLKELRVIDLASDGSVSVLGITSGNALNHASDLFDSNDPQPFERASIGYLLISLGRWGGDRARNRRFRPGLTVRLKRDSTLAWSSRRCPI